MKTRDALTKAGEDEMDLILIVPNANPPVAKIADFKKFLYGKEREKAQQKPKAEKRK